MANKEEVSLKNSSAGDKKDYVVAGAILSCSCGTQPSRLKAAQSHGVTLKGKAQLNINDYQPMINIFPFGNCSSVMNPAVLNSPLMDIYGVKKAPCMPVVTTPWLGGKSDKAVAGCPALLSHSTTMCLFSGTIKIENDGQELTGTAMGQEALEKQAEKDAEEAEDTADALKGELIKNGVAGAADTVFGSQVMDRLSSRSYYVTNAPGLGPAASFESVKFNRGIDVLKGASKLAGPAAVVTYGLDVYQDVQKYDGVDAAKAVTVSTAGAALGIGVGIACTGVGAPVGVAIIAGVAIGAGFGMASSWIKKKWIGH